MQPCQDSSHPNISRAFTLIELLVVIAIIAMLVIKFGRATNTLSFSCSYYYYASYYSGNRLGHRISEVRHPVEKAVQVYFASANNSLFDTDLNPPKNGAHGDGLNPDAVVRYSGKAVTVSCKK